MKPGYQIKRPTFALIPPFLTQNLYPNHKVWRHSTRPQCTTPFSIEDSVFGIFWKYITDFSEDHRDSFPFSLWSWGSSLIPGQVRCVWYGEYCLAPHSHWAQVNTQVLCWITLPAWSVYFSVSLHKVEEMRELAAWGREIFTRVNVLGWILSRAVEKAFRPLMVTSLHTERMKRCLKRMTEDW